jgi:hypothetical protein
LEIPIVTFPVGQISFQINDKNLSVVGLKLAHDDLVIVVQTYASPILFDTAGLVDIRQVLNEVVETDFERSNLEIALSEARRPHSWEVGEAIAECCATHHTRCIFPWPLRRDQRNPFANQPGSDLVGFQETDDVDRPHRFAFGEVKTSRQQKFPPGVIYGRNGLTQQLKRLCNVPARKYQLMKYLAFRAKGSIWWPAYTSASRRLLARAEADDVALFGILIRDVVPDERDFASVASELKSRCPAETHVALRGIYLPEAAIPGLAKLAIEDR